MLRKLQLLCIAALVLSVASLSAQKSLKKANKQFDLRAYELAIENYQKTLQSHPDKIDAMLGLAESYRYTKDPLSAIKWYELAFQSGDEIKPGYILRYGHTLKTVGLYEKAQQQYLEYRGTDPVVGEHFALSCDFARNLLEESENYEIYLYSSNSPTSDFGVSFFKDNIVFATFGGTSQASGNFSHIEKKGNKLLIAPSIQDAKNGNAKNLRSSLREQYGIGPLSYSREAKVVAFTRNNFSNNQQQIYGNETDLSIHVALVDEDGDFYEEKAFPHNETEYATAFPQLAFDGKAMYFSSNRPGGEGGFDIYVSYFKKGEWTTPENLGSRINSPGNEITPFFDGETLFYSSDYHHGLGGFDVFKSEVVAGQWTYPENMGKGANSPGDDYYFVKNMLTGETYVSSNRLGGRGADDIYMLKEIQEYDFADFDLSEEFEEEPQVPKAVNITNMVAEESVKEDALDEEINLAIKESFAKEELLLANDNTVEESIAKNKAVKIVRSHNAEVDLLGARRVAINSVIDEASNATVYFVQVAALSRTKPNLQKYVQLVKYGNLYKVYKLNSTKIRVGYYFERSEANEILDKVRNMGFSDAFIAAAKLNPAEMELVASPFDIDVVPESDQPFVGQVRPVTEYKVRLASYADPLWFDVESVKDMGEVEQWTKGSWTIFVLGGFGSKEEAKRALTKAITRGFVDAELVMDKSGVLKRVKD